MRGVLIDFLDQYEKQCAKEVEESGDGYKGLLECRNELARVVRNTVFGRWLMLILEQSRYYGNKYSVVTWGFCVATKCADAKMVGASGSFASGPRVIPLVEKLGFNVNDLAGDLAACFGCVDVFRTRCDRPLTGRYTERNVLPTGLSATTATTRGRRCSSCTSSSAGSTFAWRCSSSSVRRPSEPRRCGSLRPTRSLAQGHVEARAMEEVRVNVRRARRPRRPLARGRTRA